MVISRRSRGVGSDERDIPTASSTAYSDGKFHGRFHGKTRRNLPWPPPSPDPSDSDISQPQPQPGRDRAPPVLSSPSALAPSPPVYLSRCEYRLSFPLFLPPLFHHGLDKEQRSEGLPSCPAADTDLFDRALASSVSARLLAETAFRSAFNSPLSPLVILSCFYHRPTSDPLSDSPLPAPSHLEPHTTATDCVGRALRFIGPTPPPLVQHDGHFCPEPKQNDTKGPGPRAQLA